MIVIDKLCYSSKIRYVNPFEKFTFSILTLVFVVLSRSVILGLTVLFINGYLTLRLGGIPPRRYIKLMLIPLSFILLSTVAILINFSYTPLEAFALKIGNIYITSSMEAVSKCLSLVVTAFSAISCLYFLTLNTTMTDILGVLRKLHTPKLMCELMLLIYRFIFVLLDTAYYLRTAQNARLGYRTFRSSLGDFALLVQAIFIKSMKRSRALYDAMESRLYDGEIKVLEESYPISRRNVVFITIFELILLASVIWIKFGE